MKKLLLVLTVALISTTFAQSQCKDPYKSTITSINKALQIGNVDEISNHFAATIDASILSKEGIFSASQTKNILKDFFKQHKPKSFELLHSSGKNDSKYCIGNLETNNGTFRVFYIIKNSVTLPLITQFRIEEKN